MRLIGHIRKYFIKHWQNCNINILSRHHYYECNTFTLVVTLSMNFSFQSMDDLDTRTTTKGLWKWDTYGRNWLFLSGDRINYNVLISRIWFFSCEMLFFTLTIRSKSMVNLMSSFFIYATTWPSVSYAFG